MSIDLRNLLQDASVVLGTAPSVEQIELAMDARVKSRQPISIMYGETYDRYGATLDSLKYYFTVAAIGRALGQSGVPCTPTVLIADIATCRNTPDEQHEELMALGRARVEFVKAINQLYSLGLTVIAMSDYLHGESFQNRLRTIRDKARGDDRIFQWIRQTVPANKVAIEEAKGFAYAFEEVATIVEYDIKVGPPREKFYDEPARMIAAALGYKSLASVYLRPTFPLGVGPDLFLNNPEIEEFGVTPYKAGSKGLQDNRIVFGQTTHDRMAALIRKSFVNKRQNVPNAVLDTAVIAEMARQWLENDPRPIEVRDAFYNGALLPKDLKEQAIESARRYILDPVEKEVKRK